MNTWLVLRVLRTILLAALPASAHTGAAAMRNGDLYPNVEAYLADRRSEFDQIPDERRRQLEEISAYVRAQADAEHPVRLVFVCTHNSRRSQMAQLWTAAAANVYGLNVLTYSGGTEDTAFNPRAVAAMGRAGFKIEKATDDTNPIYHARMSDDRPAMTCFSKAYDNAPNPKLGFGAVMVCGEADQACPYVEGATGRFSLPFVDPKVSDDTALEEATYDERCAQIAREMLYMMSRVGS